MSSQRKSCRFPIRPEVREMEYGTVNIADGLDDIELGELGERSIGLDPGDFGGWCGGQSVRRHSSQGFWK